VNPFTGEWLPVQKEAKAAATKLHAALDELERSSLPDTELRDALEQLADDRFFIQLAWRYGPWLAEKSPVVFGPFLLSRYSQMALGRDGRYFQPWQDDRSKDALETWLRAADERDEIELFRRLYQWRSWSVHGNDIDRVWREDLYRRFVKAKTAGERAVVLKKLEHAGTLDVETAVQLYERDAEAVRSFLIAHCPVRYDFAWSRKVEDWEPLMTAARNGRLGRDDELYFAVYRKTVDEKRWERDVLALAGGDLDAELERRHPVCFPKNAGNVLATILEKRGRDAMPYTLRHLQNLWASWFGQPKGHKALVELARENEWLDLWAAILRVVADRAEYDREVRALVKDRERPVREVVHRLELLSGVSRELNVGRFGLAAVQSISDGTAVAMYERFPALLCGPFRKQLFLGWHDGYVGMTRAALEAGDEELVDYLASRVITRHVRNAPAKELGKSVELFAEHYGALLDDEREFAERAANVLGQVPPFVVFAYDELLTQNRLARLLWEHARSGYLASSTAIRDLLEAPEIHAQRVAFAALALDDPRARVLAAEHVDLLAATLLRPLRRKTRAFAFRALERACENDESTARFVVARARLAFDLPDKRYPKEQLLGVVAAALHRWPALRGEREQPRVFRRSAEA
jgi:hypothetical protein